MTDQAPQEHIIKNPSLWSSLSKNININTLMPPLGLILIIIIFAYLTDMRIIQANSINLILSQVYVLMIASAGVFLVMTIGGLDFSQGSILGLSSIVVSYLSFYNIPLAIVGGMITGGLIGFINGFFHTRFRIQSFIVTICTMFLFRGICAYITTNAPVSAVGDITNYNTTFIKTSVTLLVLAVVFITFNFTKVGLNLKAIGAGEMGARFSGIRTDVTKLLVFTSAGLITGLASFINVIRVGSVTATSGSQLETQILIALVLGGMPISGGAKARIYNIVIGTLIFCILNNGLVMMGLDTAMQQLAKGIVFVLVVAITIDRKSIQVVK